MKEWGLFPYQALLGILVNTHTMTSGLKKAIFTFVTVNLLVFRDIGPQCSYQAFIILITVKERKGTHHDLLHHTGGESTGSFT